MNTLQHYLQQALEHKVAIGHYNFATMTMARAIFDAVRTASESIEHPFPDGKIPLVLGISEGDRKLFGTREALAIVQLWREEYQYPVFLDGDHVHDLEDAKSLVAMGYDMVVYDAVTEPIKVNQEYTKQLVNYRDEGGYPCLIESEIGFISSGSEIKDSIPDGVGPETMTDPQVARSFIDAAGVDAIAPSVGNIHGLIKSGNPKLDIDRIADLRNAIGEVPMVLHGGSGTSDEDFVAAIRAGITMIHISTDIRLSYKTGLQQGIESMGDSVAPAKYLDPAYQEVYDTVTRYTKLFSGK
jgi:fructose-bisphosphate aldolase class II